MPEASNWELPPTINIHVINEVLDRLNEIFQSGTKKIVLDASNIENVDATGLQILISAYKTACKDKIELVFENPSPYLTRILNMTGASQVLAVKGEI